MLPLFPPDLLPSLDSSPQSPAHILIHDECDTSGGQYADEVCAHPLVESSHAFVSHGEGDAAGDGGRVDVGCVLDPTSNDLIWIGQDDGEEFG